VDLMQALGGPNTPSVVQFMQWIRRPIPYLQECSTRYGDAFTLRFPFYPPVALFSHPRAIRDVFADSDGTLQAGAANAVFAPVLGSASVLVIDGEPHTTVRRLVASAAPRDTNAARERTARAMIQAHVEALPANAVSALPWTQSLTLDLLLHALLGFSTGPRATTLRGELSALLEIFTRPATMMALWTCQRNLGPLTPWRSVQRRRRAVRALLHAELADAATRAEGGATVLDALGNIPAACRHHVSAETIVDQLLTILISGHETLAPTMAWAFYWLGRERELVPRLREPAYLQAFVKEVMRLTPVIITVGRKVERATVIGGVEVPAGTVVAPCVYLSHRHPEIWSEPDRFFPDRFLTRRPTAHEFYPFGGGLRHCLGADFAMMAVETLVSEFVKSGVVVAGEEETVGIRRGTSIVPPGSVRIRRESVAPLGS